MHLHPDTPEAAAFLADHLSERLAPVFRPVTHDDPAWFVAGRRLIGDVRNPDYGCVFWTEVCNGAVMFTFDREGWHHCSTEGAGFPLEGFLEKQGRLFHIAGPSDEQITAMQAAQ